LIDDKQINACCLNFVANMNGCKIAVGNFVGPSHGDRGRCRLTATFIISLNGCNKHMHNSSIYTFVTGIFLLRHWKPWMQEPMDLVSPFTSAQFLDHLRIQEPMDLVSPFTCARLLDHLYMELPCLSGRLDVVEYYEDDYIHIAHHYPCSQLRGTYLGL